MKNQTMTLALLMFVNMLSFTIVIPIFPFILRDLGANAFVYGLVLSMYPLCQFFAAPVLGALSDTYGRKKVLLLSQIGTIFGWVVFCVSYFIPQIPAGPLLLPIYIIALSRAIDGITGGNNSVANAIITDVVPQEKRGQAYATIGGISAIALIVGPGLGSLTASTSFGYFGTGLTLVAISTLALGWIWKFIPETHATITNIPLTFAKLRGQFNLPKRIYRLKTHTNLMDAFAVRFFFALIFGGYGSIIVLFIIDRFHFTQQNLGFFMLFVGTFLIFNQLVVAKYLLGKLGDFKSLIVGLLLMIIGFLAIVLITNIWVYVPVYYFLNLGFSISFPALKSLIAGSAPQQDQGEVMGIDESIVAACGAIAPIVVGYSYNHIGASTFMIFSALAGVSLFLALFLKHKSKGV